MSGHVRSLPAKRVMSVNNSRQPRSCHNIFSLRSETGQSVVVCQKFFLTTLGYSSNRVLLEMIASVRANNGVPRADKRGDKPPPHKVDSTLIKEHIESHHPVMSHYRREHAPQRRYITNETNLKKMHADFLAKHGTENKIGYDAYRKIFSSMNISFAVPETDKCDDCAFYQNSANDDQALISEWIQHKERALAARQLYREDSSREWPSDTVVFAVDLQKVLLLPRMPDLKTCIFTSRLVVFNETFAMMGSMLPGNSKVHYLAVWNESISGRNRSDIASAFHKIIKKERDRSHFVFWLDNCSSQNKNWLLYSMMLLLVNETDGPQDITLRYLVPGHTHMAADSCHGHIEKALRRKKDVLDMDDLRDVLLGAAEGISVVDLIIGDFRNWENLCKTRAQNNGIPLLRDVVEVKFIKGNRNVMYKTAFSEAYTECDALKSKVRLNPPKIPMCKTEERGILTSKKLKIVRELVPRMKSNRRAFWESLPTSDNSQDLLGDTAENRAD